MISYNNQSILKLIEILFVYKNETNSKNGCKQYFPGKNFIINNHIIISYRQLSGGYKIKKI